MDKQNNISYIEFPSTDLTKTEVFFQTVFGWSFEDYGPEYCAFSGAGVNGGFFQSDRTVSTEQGSALIVMYSAELEQTQANIETAGGSILQAIFDFPGGRRFHFADPTGNEYAVWSDK